MKNQDAGSTSANNKSDLSKCASTCTSLEKTESGKLDSSGAGYTKSEPKLIGVSVKMKDGIWKYHPNNNPNKNI